MRKTNDQQAFERGYIEGRRRTLLNALQEAMRGLHGFDTPLPKKAALLAERNEAVAKLRELCARHGDNDWPDNLHLADIIEKHLARHLAKHE